MQLTKSPAARGGADRPGAVRGGRAGTRDRILGAAERLFADHGYEACTFRMISAHSDINQGLLHYYFGTKQNLFHEVFLRRARVVADKRMALLDQAELEEDPVSAETLVRAFIEPPLRMLQEGPGARAFVRIHSQLRGDAQGFGRDLRREAFAVSTRRYVEAMRRACAHLSAETVYWRFNFMIGTYLVVVSQAGRLEDISRGACSARDVDAAIGQIVPFLVAGFASAEVGRRKAARRRR